MRKLLIIAFIASTTFVFGQGYRGKRFSVSYQPGYSMVNWLSLKFVHHHKLNLGFSAGKHFSINLHGSYSASSVSDFNNYTEGFIKDVSGGVSFLYFRKMFQSYSPIGRYMGVGFDYGVQNTERTETELNDPTDPSSFELTYYYYDDEERSTLMMISAIFGRNYLLKEKFMLGYGMQWGIELQPNQPMRHLCKPFVNLGIIF